MGVALAVYFGDAIINDKPVTFRGIASTVVVTAVSAGFSYGIGTAATHINNFFVRASAQALAHGITQGGMTVLQGGKFWSGFAAGAVSSIMSSVWQGGNNTTKIDGVRYSVAGTGTKGLGDGFVNKTVGTMFFGTISGGAAASVSGGNFWRGAVSGLIVSGLNHAMHRAEDAFARHKFDKEIDAAYGSKADSAAPATDATLTNMVDDVPTLKSWYGKSGKPGLWAQSKYTYAPSDGISEAKTFANDTDNYKSSSITFFKSSFASYRTLAYNMLHEFGHAYYNYTGQLASMIGKYGQYSNKPQAFSEVYAFKFAFQYGGVSYSNNAWYQINLARTK